MVALGSTLRSSLPTYRSRVLAFWSTVGLSGAVLFYLKTRPTPGHDETRRERFSQATDHITPPAGVGPVNKQQEAKLRERGLPVIHDGPLPARPHEVWLPRIVTRDNKARPDATDATMTVPSSKHSAAAPSSSKAASKVPAEATKAMEEHARTRRFVEARDSTK